MTTYHNPGANHYIPDHIPIDQALSRITHLGIGAHQDDLEIMAFHGIIQCFQKDDQWFGGITCTNGEGSPRINDYKDFSNNEMKQIRQKEQKKAADIGQYGIIIQLDYSSQAIKTGTPADLIKELKDILSRSRPRIVYTHNPADKHDTHVAVTMAVVKAIRLLDQTVRPQRLYGCETWRDLDWLPDEDKILLDVSGYDPLAEELLKAHNSQISGGKRYDLATIGRRHSNATFFQSHQADKAEQLWFAMDLTPLITNDSLSITDFVLSYINKFSLEVKKKLKGDI